MPLRRRPLFNWVNQRGNSSLTSETADSITFGFVMNSPFDSPWLANTTLSLDYYKVEIEDAIMLYSVDYANFRCFGAQSVSNTTEAAARAASTECHVGPEKPGARRTAHHVDLVRQSGHDRDGGCGHSAELDAAVLGLGGGGRPGGVGIQLQATWLDYYTTKQSPAAFDVETEWKGSLGPNLSGTNGAPMTTACSARSPISGTIGV